MIETSVQPLLRLPGVSDDSGRLSLLSTLEIDARLWSMTVAPCGLDEDMPAVAIAGLGDRSQSLPVTARVFAGDQAEVAGELRGPLEAAPVDDLGREHHRGMERDALGSTEAE